MTIEVSCNFRKVFERAKNNYLSVLWYIATILGLLGLFAPYTMTSIKDGEVSFDPRTGKQLNTKEVIIETLFTLANGKGDDIQTKMNSAVNAAGLLLGIIIFVFYGETLGRSESKTKSTCSIYFTFFLYLIATILALIPIGIVNENKDILLGENVSSADALVSGPGIVSMVILAAGGFLLSGYYFFREGIFEALRKGCYKVTKSVKSKGGAYESLYN